MPKIIYAASNRKGARHQLTRVLTHLPKEYEIKVAGYKDMGLFLDWTLDALLNPFNPQSISIDNDNFEILFNQINTFKPDLIISDLEYFTSYAGQTLNIPVWQVSPLLLKSLDLGTLCPGAGKYRSILYHSNYVTELITNIITNSNKKIIYSHLFDTVKNFNIPEGFQWVRPYYRLGNKSVACEHKVMAVIDPAKLKYIIKHQPDTVIFSTYQNGLNYKHIDNASEYACNLKNCQQFITDGCTDTLADAFYNQKYSIIVPDLFDHECIINMLFTKQYKLGTIAYGAQLPNKIKNIDSTTPSSNVSFLHQEINNFLRC